LEHAMSPKVGLSPEFLTPAVYANLANSHQKLGNHRRAIELAERFRDSLFQDVAQHPDYQEQRLCAFEMIGTSYALEGNHKASIENFQAALAVARNLNDSDGEIRILCQVARTHSSSGRHQSSMETYSLALERAKEIGNKRAECEILSGLGNTCTMLGHFEMSIDLQQQVMEAAKELDDDLLSATARANLGVIYRSVGESEKAVENFELCMEMARKADAKQLIAMAYCNLGNVYNSAGKSEQALEMIEQSRNVFVHVGDACGEAKTYLNMGECYLAQQKYRKSIEMFDSALPILIQVGDTLGQVSTLLQSGQSYLMIALKSEKGSEEQVTLAQSAWARFDKTLSMTSQLSKLHVQHTNFQVHVELAKVCYLLKDENKAVEHLANHLKHNVAIGRTLCTGCGKTRGSFLCDRLETSSHVSVDSCVTCPVPVLGESPHSNADGEVGLSISTSTLPSSALGANQVMLTCSGCKVARYCNQEHQRQSWMHEGHRILCPLLCRWKAITKGDESEDDLHEKMLAALPHLVGQENNRPRAHAAYWTTTR